MRGAGERGYGFEAIDEALPYMPLAVRRALDVLGYKLGLDAWQSLSLEDRRRLVRAGAGESVDPDAHAVIARASPAAFRIEPKPDPEPAAPPAALVASLGPTRPLEASTWSALGGLDRYALCKYLSNGEKLALAYDEIVGATLTHLTPAGAARMVDVGGKSDVSRRAIASARVRTTRRAVDAVAGHSIEKGDVLAAARIAGILASKRTAELVPLCHPVRTTQAEIDFDLDAESGELRVRATVEAVDRTGVEMEAMVAASVASLTVYDMIKSVDRWATIDSVRLEFKSGGKSGSLVRPPERGGS